jgi:hypothetical protein
MTQSLAALATSALLIALSFSESRGVRTIGAVACVVALVAAALSLPLRQQMRVGDFETYTSSRTNFDFYMGGGTVRFEAHLSSMLLRWIDRWLGATAESPREAFALLAMLATCWFGGMLVVAAWVSGWSQAALRYIGLAVAAPVTLMYFGYRELGYLSLNAAAFPLIVEGLRGARARFEAGCALSGLGAALHGFGALSLAGAGLSSLTARAGRLERLRLAFQAFAFGTSAYLIWIFVYVVGMRLSVTPGHAGSILWRPLLVSQMAEHRLNHAVVSAHGAAEILTASWIVGLPLLLVALFSRRRLPSGLATPLAYALPSVLFLPAFWPIQGLAVDVDLVFAAFPAVYALIWMCAQSSGATLVSLALLASAHVAFWRVMLGDFFVNPRVY